MKEKEMLNFKRTRKRKKEGQSSWKGPNENKVHLVGLRKRGVKFQEDQKKTKRGEGGWSSWKWIEKNKAHGKTKIEGVGISKGPKEDKRQQMKKIKKWKGVLKFMKIKGLEENEAHGDTKK